MRGLLWSHRSRKKNVRKPGLETLESRELLSVDTSAAALALVPDSAVTAQAVHSGNWSEPGTWQNRIVPTANANVLIPSQISVTLDGTTNPLHWVRIDGTLQFAPNTDTNLIVDTVVETMNGTLQIGTATSPIPAVHHAGITFTSNGPINTTWDPTLVSRGLVTMGTVTMYGAATTPYITLSQNALRGSTTLVLSQPPTNWHVGDEIVLGGTYSKVNQDEDLRILGIQGSRITISPLAYSHTATNDIPVYLTDVTRNIVLQSQNSTVIGDRGHVLLMCADMVDIHYAEFLGLGRTNKSVPINDPQLDANGRLIPGTGTNPRDRYSVALWDDDDAGPEPPGYVDGSTVVGSPGWGFVNHSSVNVHFTNDVAFNVDGASFVSDAGNETGSFDHDLAIHSVGATPVNFTDPARLDLQDFGHEGDGFWLQGNGVTVTNCIAIGQPGVGFYYWSKSLTPPVQDVPQSNAPLTGFQNNLAESCRYGVYLRYEIHGGTVDQFTAHNCVTGYKQQYSSGITLQNSNLYGTPFSDYGVFLPVESATGFVGRNLVISGWPVGFRFSEECSQSLIGATFSNNQYSIEIPISIQGGRRITISNVSFAPDTTRGHYDVYWAYQPEELLTRNINAFFAPDVVLYNNVQLFAPWQSANFVPFPRQDPEAPPIPSALIGMTNLQLSGAYGLVMGGIISPPAISGAPRSNGTTGVVVSYPGVMTLSSCWHTNQDYGYRLSYRSSTRKGTSVSTLYNLQSGWNMLIVTVLGSRHAFFVYEGF